MTLVIVSAFAFVTAATVIIAYVVTTATEPPSERPRAAGRHVAPSTPGVRSAGPHTGPIYFGALHGTTSEIPVPTPRPFTPADGIPRLVVDSPPGARGVVPVDVADLPLAFRPSCSWCLDGVRVPHGLAFCPVCHCTTRGRGTTP